MILATLSFLLHYYYVYNFENHYWILHIQYQFTIVVHRILLNTIQYKKKIDPIVSLELNENRCMRSFDSITICYIQDPDIQNI